MSVSPEGEKGEPAASSPVKLASFDLLKGKKTVAEYCVAEAAFGGPKLCGRRTHDEINDIEVEKSCVSG